LKKQTIMKSTDRLGIIIILLIVLACQLSLLQKASVWMESGLRSAIQKEVLIFIVEDISSI
jgi:hypothetical protein